MRIRLALAVTFSAAALALSGCSSSDPGEETASADLVVYSGRSEELVGPLIAQFEAETGSEVQVRYGDTPELAAQLLEEGDGSPADVFFSQDAGALQVLQDEGLTAELPATILDRVPAKFRSADGKWVGASGRARVMVYNTDQVADDDLPRTVEDLTAPQWKSKVGIAPTNASFQSFVTAMRMTVGEEETKKWLEGLVANDVQKYESNSNILDAVNAGQVDIGLVNHYYLYEKAAEIGEENVKAKNAAFAPGDPGNLVNVAGLAAMGSTVTDPAAEFIAYMLSDSAQEYFAQDVAEYPLVKGIPVREGLPPLAKVDGPNITLDQLRDLSGTQEMLMQVGLL